MKCCMNLNCGSENVLNFDVDLRIAQEVRIGKLQTQLVPQKDRLGKYHLCAHITHLNEEKEREMSVDCIVLEDNQAYTIRLLFPENVHVNILKDGTGEKINLLEYRIDKFTEKLTETASFSLSHGQGSNFITVDLTLMDTEYGTNTAALQASVLAQLELIDDWTKPMIVKFIKDNRYSAYLSTQCVLFQTKMFSKEEIRIKIAIPETTLRQKLGNDVFHIIYTEGKVTFESSMDESDYNTIFLHEDCDGINGVIDTENCLKGDWEKLHNLVELGLFPTVYLKTIHTDAFHPAYYSMDANRNMGKIGCLFLKEINGKKYLANDEFILTNGSLQIGDLYTPVYTEIPLEGI